MGNTLYELCFNYCHHPGYSGQKLHLNPIDTLPRNFKKRQTDSETSKVKVKWTLVQALRLCTGLTVHRGSRGIALFLDHGTRSKYYYIQLIYS